jgi:hypothetical protein
MTSSGTAIDSVAFMHARGYFGTCSGCGEDKRKEETRGLCARCASLTEAPPVRLGKHEKAILLACLATMPQRSSWNGADRYTDELPQALYGMSGRRPWYRRSERAYLRNTPATITHWLDAAQRNRVQATISRAIKTLYAKGLIDCGNVYEATGHRNDEQRKYIKTMRLTKKGTLVAEKLAETLRLVAPSQS